MPPEPKKILVVDDELGIRELLSEFLEGKGYKVLTAVDGPDGLEQAMKTLPDLILLDLMMPKMDGWQVLSRLHDEEKTRHIPVAMLTARGNTVDLLKSEHARAVDYFIKPVNLEELLLFIQRYIH